MNPPASSTAPELATQLASLTAGLLFFSESDAPLEVVSYARPAGGLLNSALLPLLGEPAEAPLQVVTLAYFLRNHTTASQDPTRQATVARYQALQAFMEQHLRAVQVYRVGAEPRIQAYALGEAADGQLVGFKTLLIET